MLATNVSINLCQCALYSQCGEKVPELWEDSARHGSLPREVKGRARPDYHLTYSNLAGKAVDAMRISEKKAKFKGVAQG